VIIFLRTAQSRITAQQGKCAKKNLKHSRVSAREKKSRHSRVSEKQDNNTSEARKKKLGQSRAG